MPNVIAFEELSLSNVGQVGGKNASLGEMIQHLSLSGVSVPTGFATTAQAYQDFLSYNKGLGEKINQALELLDVTDVAALKATGKQIREWILQAKFSDAFKQDIEQAYQSLIQKSPTITFAVRSSATAEDLPTASFAGQQETYLNIIGLENLFDAVKRVFASLFTNRAITYRVHHGFEHHKVSISAGVQRMVRSDLSVSGVMFSLDTETGFRDVVFINAAYGLGETIVQGTVNPDEYTVYKPAIKNNLRAILMKNLGSKKKKMVYAQASDKNTQLEDVSESAQKQFALTNAEIETLARYAIAIEEHYQLPMDIEWAKDGLDGQLYIVQARPETVKSQENKQIIEQYQLKKRSAIIVEGRSIGEKIGRGVARVLQSIDEMDKVQPGDILVTDMTDPDWEPIMKRASAIVTNRGGRTCHAAIVARELGVPAVVGCQNATTLISDGSPITVSCAEGETGYVYEGILDFNIDTVNVATMPELPVKIMMNMANPERAFAFSQLPNYGVGLARLEFIITSIGLHPNALLHFDELPLDLQNKISARTAGYDSPVDFYVEKMREGIATICAAFYPKPVILRTSDFKSNEYANLLGGDLYEPEEENPMIGFRGASRYVDDRFRACFELECRAIKKVRDEMGLTNLEVMIPFVRTVEEGASVIDVLAQNGLRRGENGLRVIMMCEVPSNPLLAEDFLKHYDGFSIGSNDLTQLTLGLDRDSDIVAHLFNERNEAVKALLSKAIRTCNQLDKYIGICGQGPSDYPDLAKWLMEEGIGSMSLNPDTVVKTWMYLAKMVAIHD